MESGETWLGICEQGNDINNDRRLIILCGRVMWRDRLPEFSRTCLCTSRMRMSSLEMQYHVKKQMVRPTICI